MTAIVTVHSAPFAKHRRCFWAHPTALSRRFAANFALKPALPSSAQAGKAACNHALFLPAADEETVTN